MPVAIKSLKLWFPIELKSSTDDEKTPEGIFQQAESTPTLTDNAVLRVNLYIHYEREGYMSLHQPISELKASPAQGIPPRIQIVFLSYITNKKNICFFFDPAPLLPPVANKRI